jgi:hypothetical protein
VFLDERMYRFTGGQPGTLEGLRPYPGGPRQRPGRDGAAQLDGAAPRRRAGGGDAAGRA